MYASYCKTLVKHNRCQFVARSVEFIYLVVRAIFFSSSSSLFVLYISLIIDNDNNNYCA